MWHKFTDGYSTAYIQLKNNGTEDYYDIICVCPGYRYKNRAGYCSFGLGLEDLNDELDTEFTDLNLDMPDIASAILEDCGYGDNFFIDFLTPLGKDSQDGKYGYNEFGIDQYEIGDKNLKYYLGVEGIHL